MPSQASGSDSAQPLKHWTVTVDPGADFAAVLKALRQAGLQVDDSLDVMGVVNGRAPARLLKRLQALPGVQDVAPLLGIDIGPPGQQPS